MERYRQQLISRKDIYSTLFGKISSAADQQERYLYSTLYWKDIVSS
jgi:hypothetical protein